MRHLIALPALLLTLAASTASLAAEPQPANPVNPAATGLITVATIDSAEAAKPVLAALGCAAGVCLTAAPIDALAKGESPARLFAGKVEGGWAPYVVKDQTALKLQSAKVVRAPDGTQAVQVVLDPPSARLFAALTARAIGERLAIIVDGRVVSAPKVMETITGGTLRIDVGLSGDAGAMLKALRGG